MTEISKLVKVLVVEDNADALVTLCEMLSILGFEAIGISNGQEALDALGNFDILFTDNNLPGMSGIELASKVHALYPAKPIIISSGMDITTRLPFEIHFLPKPFRMSSLSDLLNKCRENLIKD